MARTLKPKAEYKDMLSGDKNKQDREKVKGMFILTVGA